MSPHLRPVDALIGADVDGTIRNLPHLAESDQAAVRLAREYAAVIDDAGDEDRDKVLERFGPKLLAVLEQLGATPKARAARKGGGSGGEGKLAQLRASRPA